MAESGGSDERLHTRAFQYAPEAMVILSSDAAAVLDANIAFERLVGWSRRELVGTPTGAAVWIDPLDAAGLAEHVDPFTLQGVADVVLRERSGDLRKASLSLARTPGDPPSLLAIVHDVTDRSEVEVALRESEERYRSLVEHLPAVVYLEAPELDERGEPTGGREVFVSPQIEEMLGYTSEEWTIDVWADSLHPDDRGWVLEHDRETEERGEPYAAEYREYAKDGRVVWVHEEARLLSPPGAPRRWQGIAFDITARKVAEQQLAESEARFRTLVEQIPAVTYMEEYLDPEGPLEGNPMIYVSPQIERIWGVSRDERMEDPKLWRKLLHPDDRERAVEADLASSRTGTPLIADYRLVRPSGEVAWIREDTRLIRGANGAPLYWLGVMFDVTEATQKAEALELSLVQLKQLDGERRALLSRLVGAQEQERRQVAAAIHDDSVQSISAINLRLEVVKRRSEDEATRDELDRVQGEVREAIRRLRYQMFVLWPPELDKHGLADALRTELSHATYPDTSLRAEVHDAMRAEPDADTRTIAYRIAQEAIANARKHAEADRLVIHIEDRSGGMLVRVHDDGKGFRPTEIVSEPGHLGLSAMRERAELAGGWLTIEGGPGRGTTVEFWLPIRSGEEPAGAHPG